MPVDPNCGEAPKAFCGAKDGAIACSCVRSTEGEAVCVTDTYSSNSQCQTTANCPDGQVCIETFGCFGENQIYKLCVTPCAVPRDAKRGESAAALNAGDMKVRRVWDLRGRTSLPC